MNLTMAGLNATAVVYMPNEVDGDYTEVVRSALKCRLANKRRFGLGDGTERDEEVPNRMVMWQADYVMPENAQIEVDGQRWNVVPDTYAEMRGLGEAVMYRRCEVTQA